MGPRCASRRAPRPQNLAVRVVTAVHAVPRIAGGRPGLAPAERLAGGPALPFTAELRLHLFERTSFVPAVGLPAVAVGRAVRFVVRALLDVGTALVVLAPVLVFHGRVDRFGHALAGQAAGDGAHGAPDGRAHGPGNGSDGRSGGAAARRPHPHAHGMRPGGLGDGITVGVGLVLHVLDRAVLVLDLHEP